MTCPDCEKGRVKVGSARCPECYRLFFDDDWEEWFKVNRTNGREYADTLTKEHMLCCDDLEEDCVCEESMEWADIYLIDQDSFDGVYEIETKEGKCAQCVHYYSVGCLPLRSWARTMLLENTDLGKISDMCGNFTHFSEAEVHVNFI